MAIQAHDTQRTALREPGARDGRRLLALPGVVAIVGALITAAVSFAILVGVTPITPDETTTLTLIAVNAAFVLFLIALIGREVHRIVMAPAGTARRRRGCMCASSPCSRWSRRSPPSWSPSSPRSRSISASTAGSRSAPRRSSTRRCRSPMPMCRRTPAICRARRCRWPTISTHARSLYGLDRTGFLDLMSQEAVGAALAHAALIKRGRLGHHERQDRRRFRHAASRPNGRRGQRRRRQAGADRAANRATSSARSSSCARSRAPISTRSGWSIPR